VITLLVNKAFATGFTGVPARLNMPLSH
jgi:hypothetical protein